MEGSWFQCSEVRRAQAAWSDGCLASADLYPTGIHSHWAQGERREVIKLEECRGESIDGAHEKRAAMRTTWSGGIKHAYRNKFLEHGLRCAAVKRQARIGRIAKDLVGDSGECESENRSEGFVPVEPNTKLTLVLASPAHFVIREVESAEKRSWRLW